MNVKMVIIFGIFLSVVLIYLILNPSLVFGSVYNYFIFDIFIFFIIPVIVELIIQAIKDEDIKEAKEDEDDENGVEYIDVDEGMVAHEKSL